jgi:FMN phosphatase YigB (HAD superfamily)
MNKEVEHIIFDLGGVLLNIDMTRIVNGFGRILYPNEEAGVYVRQKLVPDYETGRISTNEFLAYLETHLKSEFDRNEVINVWNSIFLDFPKERLDMLDELKKNYQVHLLSNINDMHADQFETRFKNWFNEDPRKYFHKFFYSHQIGKRKPDVDTFVWVAREINSDPTKILFIDDLEENILGAKNAGLNAEHLDLTQTDVRSLMKKLGYLK